MLAAVSTEAAIVKRIARIKTELAALGDLRPGSLSEQYNTCGTPNCRCKADPPQRHGPYWHLSYTHGGRSRTESVRPEHLAQVRTEIDNYQRLKTLVDEWVEAGIELDRLKRADKVPARRSK